MQGHEGIVASNYLLHKWNTQCNTYLLKIWAENSEELLSHISNRKAHRDAQRCTEISATQIVRSCEVTCGRQLYNKEGLAGFTRGGSADAVDVMLQLGSSTMLTRLCPPDSSCHVAQVSSLLSPS